MLMGVLASPPSWVAQGQDLTTVVTLPIVDKQPPRARMATLTNQQH